MRDDGGRSTCWYCGGELCWGSDFNYDEVFGEGEGIATYLHCMSCGASVEYSLRTDVDENGEPIETGKDEEEDDG